MFLLVCLSPVETIWHSIQYTQGNRKHQYRWDNSRGHKVNPRLLKLFLDDKVGRLKLSLVKHRSLKKKPTEIGCRVRQICVPVGFTDNKALSHERANSMRVYPLCFNITVIPSSSKSVSKRNPHAHGWLHIIPRYSENKPLHVWTPPNISPSKLVTQKTLR